MEKQLLQVSCREAGAIGASSPEEKVKATLRAGRQSHNPRAGNGDDEAPSAIAVFLLLLEYLLGKIPRQQQKVIRHALQKDLIRHNWNVLAGHKASVLVSVAIGHKINELFSDSAVVDKSASLCRCSIGGNMGASSLQFLKQVTQVVSDIPDFLSKVVVVGKLSDVERRLGLQHIAHGRGGMLRLFDIDAKRAAVNREMLHVIEEKGVHAEETVQGSQGKITEMLVIDGVEFAAIHQILHVGHLQDGNPIVFEQRVDPLHKSVQIRDMSENIVADDDVRLLAGGGQFSGQTFAEERAERGDADVLSGARRSLGGINAQDRNALLNEIFQEITIVAGQLDHQAAGVKPPQPDQIQSILPRMLQQCGRERGVIGIILAKQNLRRHGFQQLHQAAALAESHIERKCRFRL